MFDLDAHNMMRLKERQNEENSTTFSCEPFGKRIVSVT